MLVALVSLPPLITGDVLVPLAEPLVAEFEVLVVLVKSQVVEPLVGVVSESVLDFLVSKVDLPLRNEAFDEFSHSVAMGHAFALLGVDRVPKHDHWELLRFVAPNLVHGDGSQITNRLWTFGTVFEPREGIGSEVKRVALLLLREVFEPAAEGDRRSLLLIFGVEPGIPQLWPVAVGADPKEADLATVLDEEPADSEEFRS